ncbi:hypothetical protein FGO68_gene8875 [Halteria grandinella]|uniref:Uncharacterized protein n=1 Tax=Halteria grandinella TaxID=5974 RepID=A0A8J8T1H3_HALGN|nr:hypothetical protein FGO68_gene8875 [Halteria grandinella]
MSIEVDKVESKSQRFDLQLFLKHVLVCSGPFAKVWSKWSSCPLLKERQPLAARVEELLGTIKEDCLPGGIRAVHSSDAKKISGDSLTAIIEFILLIIHCEQLRSHQGWFKIYECEERAIIGDAYSYKFAYQWSAKCSLMP